MRQKRYLLDWNFCFVNTSHALYEQIPITLFRTFLVILKTRALIPLRTWWEALSIDITKVWLKKIEMSAWRKRKPVTFWDTAQNVRAALWQLGIAAQAPKTSIRPLRFTIYPPKKPHLIKPNHLQQSGDCRYRVIDNLKHENFAKINQIFMKKKKVQRSLFQTSLTR
jgi:hypothetical protein